MKLEINKKLSTLQKIGDKCVLSGHIPSLRVYAYRYQVKSGLSLSTKSIDGYLHVIVIEVK